MIVTAEHSDCFHCGEPLTTEVPYHVVIDGIERSVCCPGCQAVAALIASADMTAFYRQRTDFPPSGGEAEPDVAEWFADDSWVASFSKDAGDAIQIPLLVSGMTCAACTWLIERLLMKQPGVLAVDINLTQSRIVLTLGAHADRVSVIHALTQLGYRVRPWRTDDRLEQLRSERRRDTRQLGVAGLGMMQVGMFAIALHAGELQGMDNSVQQLLRWFSAPVAVFVLIYSGRSFFTNAWHHLKRGVLVMDASVSLALLLATSASLWATFTAQGDTYYDSVTMFVFFLLLARFVERRMRDSDLFALAHMEDELPEFVAVRRDGQWQRTARAQLEVGDCARIVTGEALAFDGTVIAGHSTVTEAVFNGEALPREVGPGDAVYAGTINQEGTLECKVTSHYRDSRLAALSADVDTARRAKPVFLRMIDQIAARFVAFVIAAAAVTAIGWWSVDSSRSLWTALAVLVIACPCALSLATPAAMASTAAWLRQRSVRVCGEYGLLAAAEASHVLIDKTGTLTDTDLSIGAVRIAQGQQKERVLALAAALQQSSSHPAARPFHALDSSPDVEHVHIVAGAGVEGQLEGKTLRLGSDAFCRELAPSLPPAPNHHEYWIALTLNDQWLAWIALSEQLRPGAQACIDRFKQLGLGVTILSGDRSTRVAQIAETLGVEWRAPLTPRDKLAQLQACQAQHQRVIAVGDGLNDAPLLGAADASIAVASANALAKAQADFVVVDSALEHVTEIVEAARRGRRIMRQNLFWAGAYNVLGIPAAALGYVPPWAAAIGMSLSSLLVVINALRLRGVAS